MFYHKFFGNLFSCCIKTYECFSLVFSVAKCWFRFQLLCLCSRLCSHLRMPSGLLPSVNSQEGICWSDTNVSSGHAHFMKTGNIPHRFLSDLASVFPFWIILYCYFVSDTSAGWWRGGSTIDLIYIGSGVAANIWGPLFSEQDLLIFKNAFFSMSWQDCLFVTACLGHGVL